MVVDTVASDAREADQWLAFKAGDRQAFAEILDRYYPALLRYGYRLYPDKEFVKDCTHDMFVDLWNSRSRLSDVLSVKAYLFGALRRNILRESSRSKWRHIEPISDQYCFDDGFHIEASLIAGETEQFNTKKLQFHLDQLSKRQREALFLKYSQELSYDQIAATMGINYRSAVNLVHEALKAIRKSWLTALIWAFSNFA
ncbi:MAG: RNA polymerase sigma factor [Dyadobacter fermentans]